MDLLKQTKQICNLYGIVPARSKGQNFLINETVYDKIVDSAGINKDDTVLEVGPGLGFLTAKLAKKAKKVVSVELDDKLAGMLKIAVDSQQVQNVEIINKNILDFDISQLKELMGSKSNETIRYKIVANLPYNITSVFLRKFIAEEKDKPESMVLMLQKEVAERITAKVGKMSLLAVSVQLHATAEIIENVPAKDFWPAPEVESAVIKIEIKDRYIIENEKDFFRLVKFGFGSKRKMLKNNLAGGYHLTQQEAAERIKKAGFDEKIRAQELSVADWLNLLQYFN